MEKKFTTVVSGELSGKFAAHLKSQQKFQAFKRRQQELESQGKRPRVAWERAAEEFGLIEFVASQTEAKEQAGEEADAEFAQLAEKCKAQGSDPVADLDWAYKNLGRRKLSPQEAPTPGAFAFWEFARSARNKFMELVIKHLIEEKTEEDKRRDDDKREQFEIIDKLLEQEA